MKTSRRTFLRAAGVGLSLPVLESFGASPAKASPKRMIAINQDLGFIPKRFFPETSGKDYALSLTSKKSRRIGSSSPCSAGSHIPASTEGTAPIKRF